MLINPLIYRPFSQYQSDGEICIPFGGICNKSNILLKGKLTDPDGDGVSMEVEIMPVGKAFSNAPFLIGYSDGKVQSGDTAMVFAYLPNGAYHWQARTIDSNWGDKWASEWVSAGGNSENEADFIVAAGMTLPSNTPPNIPSNGRLRIVRG